MTICLLLPDLNFHYVLASQLKSTFSSPGLHPIPAMCVDGIKQIYLRVMNRVECGYLLLCVPLIGVKMFAVIVLIVL